VNAEFAGVDINGIRRESRHADAYIAKLGNKCVKVGPRLYATYKINTIPGFIK